MKLIAVLAAGFPGQRFPDESQDLFAKAIEDLELEATAGGISDLIATVERLPAVAAIREASRARSGDLLGVSWAEAWTELLEAAGRVGRYRDIPEWKSQRMAETVRAIGWTNLLNCHTRDLGTLRAQFRDIWRDKADAERVAAVTTRGELEGGDRKPIAIAAELGEKMRLKP